MLNTALAAQRMSAESPAWSMLRAAHAGPVLAMLGEHLATGAKRLPAPVLFERVEEDLAVLRDNGFDLPRTAQQYCADWRDAGFLIRRAAEGAREETFELSEGALTAIRFAAQLAAPRASVTESRLTTILQRLRDLATETDPDAASRVAALTAERDRIEAEIARVGAGDFEVLEPERAVERALDILALADELPADFARVRSEMEQLNRSLRERLIEQADSRGTVLADIFRGVDHLAESDAGRSFAGFYSLVLDAERSTAVEDDIQRLLDRPFADRLDRDRARVLRRLLPAMQDSSGEIHDVMTSFSRSLRRFVQSQEFQEDRRINELLRRALRSAMAVSDDVPPYRRTELTLALTSVPLDSVSAPRPHNPADTETTADVLTAEPAQVDVAALRELARAAEIDMRELTTNVNEVLAQHGPTTIAEVLRHRPATQGVASVVGLLVLAERHGVALGGQEAVTWASTTGVPRAGTVPLHLFKEALL